MSYRFLAVAFAGFLTVSPANAQLDPEPKTPYLWRVVLKVEPHPLLSASFREQLKRDLAAALQPALGPLGTVDIIDLTDLPEEKRTDALWQQFVDKGFDALDAPRDLTGAKTHFLKIAYADGKYHLESRQHDGFAGLASPIVRKQSVRAPELVGRTAGIMIDRDFGLVASMNPVALADPKGEVKEVTVTVRGGQLGSLDRFVKIGDVFSVSQVTKTNRPAPPPVRTATGKIIAPPPGSVPPPGLTSTVRPFTLLRVSEVGKDGTLRCSVLTRYANPVGPGSGVVGYRCVRLGTIEAPLTVRLVTSDPAYERSVGQARVQATEQGFTMKPEVRDAFDFKDGLFRSARPMANVACVVVSYGKTQKQFPVPVLDREPVSLPFEINEKLEREAEYLREVLAAASRIADARNAQTICFEATAKLIEKQKNADALARAKNGFQSADAVDKLLTDDLARLDGSTDKTPDAVKLLANVQQQLVALRQFNRQLETHVKTLEMVVARENDPTIAARDVQAEALNARITLLLGRGDVDEALNAYNQLATLLPDDAEVKARRDKLKADWTVKNDAHAKARDYLLKTWPAVATIPDFKESLPHIGAAVELCMKPEINDRYALRKLLTVFTAAGVKLRERVDTLDPNSATDRALAADANKVGESLADLENRITEFLK